MPKKIKIMNIKSPESKGEVRMIVMDNEVFDWGMDSDSVERVKRTIESKPEMRESIISDISSHFEECFRK